MQDFCFSENLIEETILCFKEEHGLDISKETANEYLNSFATLYLLLGNSEEISHHDFLRSRGGKFPVKKIT